MFRYLLATLSGAFLAASAFGQVPPAPPIAVTPAPIFQINGGAPISIPKITQAGSSYVGSCDTISSGSCVLFYGLVAGKASYATGSNPAVDWSCNAGANTGTANIGTNGIANLAATSVCVGTISATKIYEQISGHAICALTNGTATNELSIVLATKGSIPVLVSNGVAQVNYAASCDIIVASNVTGGTAIAAMKRVTTVGGSFTPEFSLASGTDIVLGFGTSGEPWFQWAGGLQPNVYTEATWTQVTGVEPVFGGTQIIYVDGTSQATRSADAETTSGYVSIGGSTSSGTYTNGQIIYAALISGNLTSGDVTNFYNNDVSNLGSFP